MYEDRSNKRTGKIVTFILILIIGTGAFFLGTVYGSLNSEEIIDNGTTRGRGFVLRQTL